MQLPIEYWKNTLRKLGVRVERRRVRRLHTGVRVGIEALERRQVMSIDSPLIAGFSVSPEIVPYGSQVTLAASGVTDPGGAAIAQVRFHIDADNDGQLTPADGAPLALDTDGSDGWSAVVSSLLSSGGNQRYFAVAQNESGINGEAVSASNTVLLPAKITDNSSSTGYSTVSSNYWSTSGGGFSGGHQFEFGATGGYAEWTFANLPEGEYRVFATWPEGTNRGTNVPYSVADGALNLATVKVNQRVAPTADVVASSKNFQDLGAFSVVNGSIVVRMTNSSGDGRAIADAIRVQHLGPAQQTSEIRVFDGESELADAASVVNLGATFYGTPSATKTLTVKNVGLADLVLTPLTQANMPAGITLVSSYASPTLARGASTTFQVRLSSTSPGAVSGSLSVTSNDPDEGSFGISVSGVVNGAKIIDNTSSTGYATVSSGYWSTSSAGYSGGHQFEFGATGGYAEWTFANLPAGEYGVSATWAEGTNRGTNVPYTIFDGSYSLGAVPVNQRIAPAADVLVSGTKFQNLGSFSSINGSILVRMTNSSGDGRAIADAVRIEYLGPAQQAPEIRVFDGGAELHDNISVVNLGTTFFGTPAVTKALTVTNSGTTGLILNPLTQADMPGGITLVSSYANTTLVPGASTTFQVRLSAMSTGAVGGVLSLSSNDPSESSFHITLTGVVDAAKIIDNGDVGYSTVSSNYWSTTAGYQFEFGATGGYAEWSFPNLPAGEYRISAAWPNDPAWSSIAPYSILDGGVSLGAVRVNQQLAPDSDVVAGGKKFQDLGLVGITSGSLTVRLTHEGPNRVVADAIRVQYIGTLPEVQFSDAGSQLVIDGATATVLDFGQSERSQKSVEVIAVTNQASSTLSLAQLTQADLPAGYLLLSGFGASTLAPGESAYGRIQLDAILPGTYGGTVPIRAGAESFNLAVAGEVLKTPVLVDNGDPGFATTGSGWQNGTAGAGFEDDYLKTSGATNGKSARWTIDDLAAGAYLVYATYLASGDNTAAAHYNLYDGALVDATPEQQGIVNQRIAPDDVVVSGKGFGYVGQINVSHGTLTVELDAASLSGGLALADAVYVVPATLGTFFGFSSPGDMVTGSAESIETGFVDPDGELVSSIGVYSDSNGNGVLDVGLDQLLSSDTTPGDGLDFDASTLATGAHRLFVAAMAADGPVATAAANVTASEWWKVKITKHRTPNEREFVTEWSLTADPKPVKLVAGLNQTWVDAVYARVSGTVHTTNTWDGQDYYYTFPQRNEPGTYVPPEDPNNKPFDVEIQDVLAGKWTKHDRAQDPKTKMIVLEDLTRSAFNDFDYDDQYWIVELEPLILGDLDVDSDNTGPINHSDPEEGVEDEWLGRLVPVAFPTELDKLSATLEVQIGDLPVSTTDVRFTGDPSLFRLWRKDPTVAGAEDEIFFGEDCVYSASVLGITAGAWRTFYVEALDTRTGAIGIEVDPNGDGQWTFVDSALLTGIQVDLDTDSNDDGPIDPLNTWPGTDDPFEASDPVVVLANTGDDDDDGVANFAEGFELDADLAAQLAAAGLSAGEASATAFERFVLTIPNAAELSTDVLVTFDYASSDPLAMTFDGTDVIPAPGVMRLWTTDGAGGRNGHDVKSGGHYIRSGQPMTLAELGILGGTKNLYLEWVTPAPETTLEILATLSHRNYSGSTGSVPGPSPIANDVTAVRNADDADLVFSTIKDKEDKDTFNDRDVDLVGDVPVYVPVNSDDDNNDEKADGTIATLSTAENDLVPFRIVPKNDTPAGTTFQLKFADPLRVWKKTQSGFDRVTRNQIITLQSLQAEGDGNEFWLEVKGGGNADIKMSLSEQRGQKSSSAYTQLIKAFTMTGPRNVPDYAKYDYVATGGDSTSGTFVSPYKGTGQNSSNTGGVDRQTVLWGEGEFFGKVRYRASADYVWAFDVAIVAVDIDMTETRLTPANQQVNGPIQNGVQQTRIDSTSAPRLNSDRDSNGNLIPANDIPDEPAMTVKASIRSVKGPTRDVDGNPVPFGVKSIELGWVQTFTFSSYNLLIDQGGSQVVVKATERGVNGADELSGQVMLDAINKVVANPQVTYQQVWADPPVAGVLTAVDVTRPWYDKEEKTGNGFEGFPSDNSVGAFDLTVSDTPAGNGYSLARWQQILGTMPGAGPSGYAMVFDFANFLAVRTTDNDAVTNSNAVYTTRVKARWQFDGTGTYEFVSQDPLFYKYTVTGEGVRVIDAAKEVLDGERLLDFTQMKIANQFLP